MELIVVFSTMLLSNYFLVATGLGWRWYRIDVCTHGGFGGGMDECLLLCLLPQDGID